MKLRVETTGSFLDAVEEFQRDLSNDLRAAVRDAGASLQEALRGQVRAAGLGKKLENAWRMETYPKGGKVTLHPAALVYSKATKLHAAYNAGGLIRRKNGQYLAIPTENVPNRAGSFGKRKPMTPVEVEAAFNHDLQFVATKSGGILTMPVVRGRKAGTLRAATKRRVQQGRKVEMVVMFWLIKQARIKKVLDIESAAAEAEAQLQASVAG